jgi:hypothetical protein
MDRKTLPLFFPCGCYLDKYGIPGVSGECETGRNLQSTWRMKAEIRQYTVGTDDEMDRADLDYQQARAAWKEHFVFGDLEHAEANHYWETIIQNRYGFVLTRQYPSQKC